jgi:hypothetical protein
MAGDEPDRCVTDFFASRTALLVDCSRTLLEVRPQDSADSDPPLAHRPSPAVRPNGGGDGDTAASLYD